MMRKTKRRRNKNDMQRWQTIGICILAIVFIFCALVSSRGSFSKKEEVVQTEDTEHQEKESQQQLQEIKTENEIVEEDLPPEIILNGNTEILLYDLEEFVEPGFKANDNEDGDLTEKVTSTTITLEEGKNYRIEYSVSDSSNNVAKVTRDIKITNGKVYLTFDDGPSSLSGEILDILKEQDVKATFFVIGENVVGREDVIEREFNEGHTIGLHGYSHRDEQIFKSIYALMGNFETVKNQVEAIIGEKINYIRFPGGTSNTVSANYCVGIMSQAVEEANKEGYVYWDWNVDSEDAYPKTTAEEVYHNVVDSIKPGKTNIVLLHDLGGNEKMLEVLPQIIEYCKQNNYELLPIDDETTLVQHPVFN